MFFWIKNIVFLIVLAALAYYLLANQESLFGTTTEAVKVETPDKTAVPADTTKVAITEEPKKVAPKPKSKNAAADGLSRFYANLHGSDAKDGPVIRNNIVYLPDPKGDLVEILEAKRLVTRPLRRNWKGTKDNRPFRKGDTLYQKLVEYAENDGLDVIWWLNRDFIVKDPFRIDKDIVETAFRLSQAIAGHFQDELVAYFCFQQRTLVLVDKEIPYLDDECERLPQKKRSRYN